VLRASARRLRIWLGTSFVEGSMRLAASAAAERAWSQRRVKSEAAAVLQELRQRLNAALRLWSIEVGAAGGVRRQSSMEQIS